VEILATLDADGTLDGLPFMPEMAVYCNRSFRVARRVEKTCVEGFGKTRRFPANDVVFLDELRCSGIDHDGCKRSCMIFWKEAWLRPAEPHEHPARTDEEVRRKLRRELPVKSDATHYVCQSTRLGRATEDFPGKYKPWMVWVALREVRVGNRSLVEAIRLLVHGIRVHFQKRRLGGDVQLLRGPNVRTPTRSLGLKAGEWVRIRSREEIQATLDRQSKNRGLNMSKAMTLNCGRTYQVLGEFDRMISERTGEMREVKNTVRLKGLECLCYYEFGGCPRGDLQYFREIWLERASAPPDSATSDA
jgi:hypothetical protein